MPKMHSSGTRNTTMISTHFEKLQRMLSARENVQKINEARQANVQNVPMPDPSEEDDGPQVTGEATSVMHDVANVQENDDSAPCLDDLRPVRTSASIGFEAASIASALLARKQLNQIESDHSGLIRSTYGR